MADSDWVKLKLAKPIQLVDHVIKSADEVFAFKNELSKLKSKSEKLASLLRQAAETSYDLYERPTRRIVHGTEQLVENLIRQVSWLLRPDPKLRPIWEQVAILDTGSLENRSNAAALLVSLVNDDNTCCKLIIEEGGVHPLLKLVEEGEPEGQENAARAIGLLGRDPDSVEHMVQARVCSVFGEILECGSVKVQAATAWAVSELAAIYPKCQHLFACHGIIRSLVAHLAFETVEEHSRYAIASHNKANIVPNFDEDDVKNLKTNAARALGRLAKGNLPICRSITKSRALLCFAVLLEKESEKVQYNSAMAVMELTVVAEEDSDLKQHSNVMLQLAKHWSTKI
ncbi:hypothetical protein LINGRAHAP2_LOCUS9776 [Linum grandiflorum]